MELHRPRSLNGLILVGFGLVALPLLVAVIWALVNLDRLAHQSERIITMGIESAENNRLLAEDLVQLQRSTNQYHVLRNEESRTIMRQDLPRIERPLRAGRSASRHGRWPRWFPVLCCSCCSPPC